MRFRCQHGYFFFEEERPGEMSTFVSTTGFDLVAFENYYTFTGLVDAPDFSLKGGAYLDAIATKTFEGKPWEVMRQNGLVYDFTKELVVPIATVVSQLVLNEGPEYFFSDFFLIPGSRNASGQKVTSYSGIARADTTKFRYTEVGYDETA